MYKRILLPLDGSKLAEVAIAHAVAQAKQSGGTLIVVRGNPLMTAAALPEGAYIDWDRVRTEMEAETNAYLQEVSGRLTGQGIAVQTEAPTGDPADVVISAAERNDADLIVMATHGRSGIGRWVLGSVADRVVRAAKAPVLLIRPAHIPEE